MMNTNINCASLLYDLKSSTPDELEFFKTYIDEEFYNKIVENEELSNAEKYILFVDKIANTVPCDDLDLFVSLIARQSRNIERCIIDKNEKIFNALNFLFDTYKKAGINISFDDIIVPDNFIARLLRRLQENFKKELEECQKASLPIEKIENLKETFTTNFKNITQKIKAFVNGGGGSVASVAPDIDISSVKSAIKEDLNNFKNSIIELINEKLSSMPEQKFNLDELNIEFPTTKLDVINENIMKLKEEMSEIITSEIQKQIEPVLNVKDDLKQTSEKLLENVSNSIMSLSKTVSEVQNLAIQINDIQKTVNDVAPIVEEMQKTINEMKQTIDDEVKKADELEAKLNKK